MAVSNLFGMITQLIKLNTFYYHLAKSLKKLMKMKTENERLLFSTNFTGKFKLVFVLARKKRFHFKANRKAYSFFKKTVARDFQNRPLFERLTFFYITITGNLERF